VAASGVQFVLTSLLEIQIEEVQKARKLCHPTAVLCFPYYFYYGNCLRGSLFKL